MLMDHNDNYITAVKLEFFRAKIEAESTNLHHLHTELRSDFFSRKKNIDTLSN